MTDPYHVISLQLEPWCQQAGGVQGQIVSGLDMLKYIYICVIIEPYDIIVSAVKYWQFHMIQPNIYAISYDSI